MSLKFTCISDTHGKHWDLPGITESELLIHCGDSNCGGIIESAEFLNWYGSQKAKYKILIAGNHDWSPFHNHMWFRDECSRNNIIYLCNESVEIEGFKIWGSPYTPEFCGWAFMKEDNDLQTIWRNIPEDVDMIVTHGPVFGILDECPDSVGSKTLLKNIIKLKPQYHICGHIHEAYGEFTNRYMTFINCTVLDGSYNLNYLQYKTGELVDA